MQVIIMSVLTLLFSSTSCNQRNEELKCKEQYYRASNYLNEYYLNQNNKELLDLSIQTIDSIDCDTFKYKISGLKISLYLLKEDYKKGIVYTESLDADKFQRPYLKKMYLNNFKALVCNEKKDTVCRDIYYMEVINDIQSYLKENKIIDALMDLYVFKYRVYPKDVILHEIDSIKRLKEYDINYLDALYESIENDSYHIE